MSWGLAAMLVLGVTLFAGFAWYERSRPPSQIVALVAALAAISVAGRDCLYWAAVESVGVWHSPQGWHRCSEMSALCMPRPPSTIARRRSNG